jgi:hypothetical protein
MRPLHLQTTRGGNGYLSRNGRYLITLTKYNCSGKGLNIWLENLRKICLTLTSLALALESRSKYTTKLKCTWCVNIKFLKVSSQILSPFREQSSLGDAIALSGFDQELKTF